MGQNLLIFVGLVVSYYVAVGLYRLFLSPLAKFPGPKLAALTLWYEYYYDIIQPGQYLWKVEEMHKKYGPIVRINPHELHIKDPSYFSEIYAGHTHGKIDKYQWWMHVLPPRSTAFTADHDLHRRRRAALATHFSKRSIVAVEPLIQSKADLLMDRFSKAHKVDEPINLSGAFAALTMDVISRYSFGESMGNLDKDDYGISWIEFFHIRCEAHPLGRQYPWMFKFFKALPPSWLEVMMPLSKIQVDFENEARRHVRKITAADPEKKAEPVQDTHRTVFHDVIQSELPDIEKSEDRLVDEAFIFLTAGTETTSRTLSVIAFHILNTPHVLPKLIAELKTAIPDRTSWVSSSVLEHLPYLHAVVAEGLRISHAFSSRLPRIHRERDLQYSSWTIPRGTPISQSTYMVHMDPSIFPQPNAFHPERFIQDPTLEKRHLVAWSKGTRVCLGMNLAYTEIYLTLAAVFRRFELELFDTTRERDVDVTRDYFIGMSAKESPGIRVRVVKETTE